MKMINGGLKFLLSLSPFKFQLTIGGVRLIFSIFFVCALPQPDALVAGNGKLGFICHPETNETHKEKCFSQYSAEMSSLMRPHIFLLVTAGILILLWSAVLLYSGSHFAKIRRETGLIERKCLCHEFWKMFLLHVGMEAAVLSVILVLYYYTHKINFAETYNCTVIIASVTTCRDVYREEFNFLFIGGMAVILFLCIVTLCQAMCNEENFIEQFLLSKTTENEAGDDGEQHSNTQSNANDGSSGFTNTNNHNEQQDALVRRRRRNMDAAQVPNVIFLNLADDVSLDWKLLGGRLSISPTVINNIDAENHLISEKTTVMLNKWKQKFGEKATVEVLRKALEAIERGDLSTRVKGEMLALTEVQLPPTEGGFDPWSIDTGSSSQSRRETNPNFAGGNNANTDTST